MLICCFYYASHLKRKHFTLLILEATAFGVLRRLWTEVNHAKSCSKLCLSVITAN